MQALMQMDCFPSGMEMFPALDEDQWEYIQRAIDECDYYVLVIAGRYGSVDATNISYTEKEYDYAVRVGKPVLALLHENPDKLAAGKTDKDDERRMALEAFRSKVKSGRLVKFWKNADDLASKVIVGMMNTIKRFPSAGWVRGDKLPDENAFEDIVRVGRENEILRENVKSLELKLKGFEGSEGFISNDIAGLSESTILTITLYNEKKEVKLSWRELYVVVSFHLERGISDYDLKAELSKLLSSKVDGSSYGNYSISDSSFDTVMIQFRALGYIALDDDVDNFSRHSEYYLTELGKSTMLNELAVKIPDS